MATKSLVLVLFFVQASYISCCVFEKVKMVKGKPLHSFIGNKNECFAACYARKNCSAISYVQAYDLCTILYEVGEALRTDNNSENYILQRDEVDPACKTFVNF